jgi:hypothetical protein
VIGRGNNKGCATLSTIAIRDNDWCADLGNITNAEQERRSRRAALTFSLRGEIGSPVNLDRRHSVIWIVFSARLTKSQRKIFSSHAI